MRSRFCAPSKPRSTAISTIRPKAIRTIASVDMPARESREGLRTTKAASWAALGALFLKNGGDLLSQGREAQVPSALRGLTALFGMGRGVAPSLSPPKVVRVRAPAPELENCTAWPPAGAEATTSSEKIKISVKPSNH